MGKTRSSRCRYTNDLDVDTHSAITNAAVEFPSLRDEKLHLARVRIPIRSTASSVFWFQTCDRAEKSGSLWSPEIQHLLGRQVSTKAKERCGAVSSE